MEHLQWFDQLRMMTATLAFGSLYALISRARRLWPEYTPRLKSLWWVLIGFLCLTAEGSIEQIILDTPFGLRNFLSFILMIFCFRAVLKEENFAKL